MTMRHGRTTLAAAFAILLAMTGAQEARAQEHAGHGAAGDAPGHAMYQFGLGGGWRLLGMAQLFPMVTTGFGPDANDAVRITEFYANQPVVMFNVESPASRLVLRTTLNFEGVTLPDGEITFGAWGEGFIDRRHPHTLLHEAVLSLNLPDVAGGTLSFSAGRGFSPYGTDDPMARPAVKFPTNHHLSQVLERYFASTAFLRGPWSVEAGVFAGNEPTGPVRLQQLRRVPQLLVGAGRPSSRRGRAHGAVGGVRLLRQRDGAAPRRGRDHPPRQRLPPP
jgi:hypothetical protein